MALIFLIDLRLCEKGKANHRRISTLSFLFSFIPASVLGHLMQVTPVNFVNCCAGRLWWGAVLARSCLQLWVGCSSFKFCISPHIFELLLHDIGGRS